MQNGSISAGAGTGDNNLVKVALSLGPTQCGYSIDITGMVNGFAGKTAGVFHNSVSQVDIACPEGNKNLRPVAERVFRVGVVPDARGVA